MKLLKTFTFLPLLCFGVEATEHHGTVELALMNSVGNKYGDEYYVNITVGTPGQLQSVLIDTGSSSTIFLASDVPGCNETLCPQTFDLSASSSFDAVSPGALYAPFGGAAALGDFVTDVVQIGDLSISKVPLGLAHTFRSRLQPYTGILGLGYSSREAINRTMSHKVPKHPSFIEVLTKANAISSRLFSVHLNKLDMYGSILFGGIDTAKYKGPLTTLNCLNSKHDEVDQWYLNLQEVTMQPHDGPELTLLRSTQDEPRLALVDTGSPDWQLPSSAYHKVLGFAGAEAPDGLWPLPGFNRPCRQVAYGAANTTHFQLTFAGNGTNTATLDLELADLFTPITGDDGSATVDRYGQPLCMLRIVEVEENNEPLIISSSVMRAGYWVFDLDNGQISLGQSDLETTSSNVVQVQAGTDGLSRAVQRLVPESQLNDVEGQMALPSTYKLSTATNTIGYTTGAQFYPSSAAKRSGESTMRLETQRRPTK
ncbi:acid protease [Aureobasidium pullulans]|uniref:Acid protease n=1 Tax=Aureobasidium pullulans TaxID=5580 RepID=A0A4S9U026_AURPU|nr:acid protease [Aureobasidium pullulans]